MDPSPSTADLEANVAQIARDLFAPGTVGGVLQRTVDLALATVDGCEFAGVFSLHDGQVVTLAVTDPVVVVLDQLQITSDEGPCVDALRGGATSYAADLQHEDRWPTFAPDAAEHGVRSTLAFHLSDRPMSALNLYARMPHAFGATDRAAAMIYATLAGLALEAAGDRADGEQRLTDLAGALRTREHIGQAQGILIERERITADQAFDVLRRASQHLNVKVREVAQTLVETGERPPTGPA